MQQDDILFDVFTPRELLKFAAKIRTSLDDDQIEKRVDSIVQRLGLESCKDQQIGGIFKRGISGGERKRTSIGYELITEPSLLLLDEPTSGLDSRTAKKTIELLKQETRRGMSILATIHQPSAEIFK